MPRTVVHVLPHTHWDREWYEPFDVFRHRLVGVADDLLRVLDAEPAFHFHFDGQTAAIEDYLEIRPDAENAIAGHVRAGRLALGPWRILMDEFLCSGETIVRNLRQGLATSSRLGADPRVGYIPDSFGHIAQMPQILALYGMRDALVWRGVPFAVDRTVFSWEAPDGTAIRTLYTPTSYSNAATLPATFEELMVRAKRVAADLAPFEPGGVVLAMNGSDHLGPQSFLPTLLAEANARQDELEFRIGPLAQYAADAPTDGARWRGEMRSSARANVLMGVLSARITLKQEEFAASVALERYAEPFAALAGLDVGLTLDRAWRGMVENSAHDSVCGCGVDAVAAQVSARYVRAARVAEVVTKDALSILASRIQNNGGIVVFNPSPYTRRDVFEVTAVLGEGACLRAPDGEVLAVQPVASTPQVVVDMTITGEALARMAPTIHSRKMGDLYVNAIQTSAREVRLDLGPIAVGTLDVERAKHDVEQLALSRPRAKFRVVGHGPPLVHALVQSPRIGGLGWSALSPTGDDARVEDRPRATERGLSNASIQIEVREDGTVDLIDRATGARYERIGLADGGDAGDEYTYSPPEKDTVVTSLASMRTEVLANGPLEARLRLHTSWKVPSFLSPTRKRRARRTVAMPVTIDLALRSGERMLRVDIALTNPAEDHRLRLRVPLPFAVQSTRADSAFAVVERALEAEGAPHETGTPTFPSRSFVDASDGARGITVLHRGTPEYECDGRALYLTLLRSVGWLSRQDLRTRSGPAGPMIPTPGAQMLGEYRFSLALAPHDGAWNHGPAESFAVPLRAAPASFSTGSLPAQGTALSIEPATVRLSSLERRGDEIDARVYNASDEDVVARITAGELLEPRAARLVDLRGNEIRALDRLEVPLRAWEIATIRLQWS